jgi:serine/threonine protein kinase
LSQLTGSKEPTRVTYKNTGVLIGKGHLGPVELVVHKGELFALKRIPKKALDNPKKIQHLKNEKHILKMLSMMQEEIQKDNFS